EHRPLRRCCPPDPQEDIPMTTRVAYETGARKLEPRTGPDPSDEFSQKAAENKKPPHGMGLIDREDHHERSEADKSDLQQERDAAGQSEDNHAGGSNDGTTSANPRVLSGDESVERSQDLQFSN